MVAWQRSMAAKTVIITMLTHASGAALAEAGVEVAGGGGMEFGYA